MYVIVHLEFKIGNFTSRCVVIKELRRDASYLAFKNMVKLTECFNNFFGGNLNIWRKLIMGLWFFDSNVVLSLEKIVLQQFLSRVFGKFEIIVIHY